MKIVSAIFLITLCALMVLFAVVLKKSGNQAPPDLSGGKIPPCDSKPNCVTSETDKKSSQYVEPIPFEEKSLELVIQSLEELGGKVHSNTDHGVTALFTSRIFGFTDDLILQLDSNAGHLKVRSSSRIGYSDMNANRKRVEALRKLIVEARNGE